MPSSTLLDATFPVASVLAVRREPSAASQVSCDSRATLEGDITVPPSFTKALLDVDVAPSWRREATRFATGLGLASLYGVALGARAGGLSLLVHAAGVPLALLAVAGLGVPALYIVLALFDAPLDPTRAASAAARATVGSGLLLAGLAPAAALFVVTSEADAVASLVAAVGLMVGGAVGLRAFLREVGDATKAAEGTTRLAVGVAFGGFAVFAVALAVRIWWSMLPLIGGAS